MNPSKNDDQNENENTAEDVQRIASIFLKETKDELGLDCGELFRYMKAMSPGQTAESFMDYYLVAEGISIPETVVERNYPAIEYLRLFPLEMQIRHIRNEEPIEVLVDKGEKMAVADMPSELRTFREIGASECQWVFQTENHLIVRAAVAALKGGDESYQFPF